MGKRSRNVAVANVDPRPFVPEEYFEERITDSGYRSKRKYVKNIEARNERQADFIEAMSREGISFGVGPAGTGKTYLAIAKAVEAMQQERVSRIILTRPAIEAGERIGFLPGDAREKLAPYLRPLYDCLQERIGTTALKKMLQDGADGLQMNYQQGVIEICPVGHMRGRTLKDSFIVIDEAQNCTYTQLKMLMTRFGEGSIMVFTGDYTQIDLPEGQSGLEEVVNKLRPVEEIPVIEFHNEDVVRHELVRKVLEYI